MSVLILVTYRQMMIDYLMVLLFFSIRSVSPAAVVAAVTPASSTTKGLPSVWEDNFVIHRINLPLLSFNMLVCCFGRVLACSDACVFLFYLFYCSKDVTCQR